MKVHYRFHKVLKIGHFVTWSYPFLLHIGTNVIYMFLRDLQKQHVVERNVGHGSVHREHETGIVQLRADFRQTEYCESPVIAFILEVVRVPPH